MAQRNTKIGELYGSHISRACVCVLVPLQEGESGCEGERHSEKEPIFGHTNTNAFELAFKEHPLNKNRKFIGQLLLAARKFNTKSIGKTPLKT